MLPSAMLLGAILRKFDYITTDYCQYCIASLSSMAFGRIPWGLDCRCDFFGRQQICLINSWRRCRCGRARLLGASTVCNTGDFVSVSAGVGVDEESRVAVGAIVDVVQL